VATTQARIYSVPSSAVAIALTLLLSVTASFAQDSVTDTDNSTSDPQSLRDLKPTPEDVTWIRLSSGEWLKGEIVMFFRGTLTFDSVKLGEQSLSFSDVREIRSDRRVQVALEDGSVAIGKLFLNGKTVRVIGDEEHEFARAEILSITPVASSNLGSWSGGLTAGLNIRSGNTDEADFMARADLERRSPKTRLMVEYLGNLSDTQGERTTDNHRAVGGWARMTSRRLFWLQMWGEYYRDPFSNVTRRWTVGAGLGYFLMDSQRVDWELTAGIAYQRTDFDSVIEGDETSAETPALVIGTRYDIEFTNRLNYSLDYRFSLASEEAGTYTHHFISGLEISIVGSLDFDISLIWDRIEDPRQNADGSFPEQDELQFVFGLGYSF